MLTVEEAPVVSIPVEEAPVARISLVTPDNWFREPVLAPAPPRFLSQDEEEQDDVRELKTLDKVEEFEKVEELVEPCFFSASANSARSVDAAISIVEAPMVYEHEETEPEASPAPPRFAELSEEPAHTSLPRDYASDFAGGVRGPAMMDDYRAQPAAALLAEADEDEQQDLEKPTFLRRLRL